MAVWLAIVVSCVATLCVAILAGRSQRIWQRFLLLALEVLLIGGALVLSGFDVWLIAKTLMASGMTASPALLLGIAIGIGLIVLAVFVCMRLVQTGYAALGKKALYTPDVDNSLWIGRWGETRPRDFRA